MTTLNHRAPTTASDARIAELELAVAKMGKKLVAVEAERDDLKATLDGINEGMRRRIDRMQADRIGANA